MVLPGPNAVEQTVLVFPPLGGVAFPGRPGSKAGCGQAVACVCGLSAVLLRVWRSSKASISQRL
jgi:hypothetical protein